MQILYSCFAYQLECSLSGYCLVIRAIVQRIYQSHSQPISISCGSVSNDSMAIEENILSSSLAMDIFVSAAAIYHAIAVDTLIITDDSSVIITNSLESVHRRTARKKCLTITCWNVGFVLFCIKKIVIDKVIRLSF